MVSPEPEPGPEPKPRLPKVSFLEGEGELSWAEVAAALGAEAAVHHEGVEEVHQVGVEVQHRAVAERPSGLRAELIGRLSASGWHLLWRHVSAGQRQPTRHLPVSHGLS
mmetsp:Transcript_20766/g.49347  ORF Transcript_20766/g.49347 Transcript_20766/m.49347 type:complete len:109 (-) Transcript_20766:337-663(-)